MTDLSEEFDLRSADLAEEKRQEWPSLDTLRRCPEESVNIDTTENLIIEEDNLEVLKLSQKSYPGKVKIIYIDPPYNTGNDQLKANAVQIFKTQGVTSCKTL